MLLYLLSQKTPFGGYIESTLYYFHIMQEGNGARVEIVLDSSLDSLHFWKQVRLNTPTKLIITTGPRKISLVSETYF